VTIGLPVYNGERYLEAALNSLSAQTLTNFELIISDNASTDRTEVICRAYAARDRRIQYVRQPTNLGVVRNFNLLVGLANAPFFKWASADDVVAPDLLERCVAVIEQDPSIVLVHSQTRFIGAKGELLPLDDSGLSLMDVRPSDRLRRLWRILGYCNAQYGVMRTDALRQTGLFGRFVGADLCFLAEIAMLGKFFEIPDHLLFRRFHEEAASNLSPEQLLEHYGFERRKLVLYHWRHLFENTKAVLRAPIDTTERLRALILVAKRMIWQRSALGQELGFMLRYAIGRPYPVLGSVGRFSPPRPSTHR
jgi:glycosyltransferase involved in cell wall biosynthesis